MGDSPAVLEAAVGACDARVCLKRELVQTLRGAHLPHAQCRLRRRRTELRAENKN